MVTINYIRTLSIDEPLARIKSDGTIRYYHADALGSVIALTDDLGQVKTQYNYSPFGETELLGEPSDNPFQYTGRENDGTGLVYYRARYYSPRLKRFVSEDPIRIAGGINIYLYVKNNPLNLRDPSGLKTMKDPQCVAKCTAKCGGGAGQCAGEIIYLPTCEVICLTATCGEGVLACQFVCIPVTAYSVYSCLKETKECMEECVKNCPDIPVNP